MHSGQHQRCSTPQIIESFLLVNISPGFNQCFRHPQMACTSSNMQSSANWCLARLMQAIDVLIRVHPGLKEGPDRG